jgi:hypothetical protein
MGKIVRFRLPPDPDACTWEEALQSGLEIYAPGELPPGVEESDFDGAYAEPAEVVQFVDTCQRRA